MKPATRKLTALDTNVLARYYVQAEEADALHHASSRHCEVFATFDTKGFAKRAVAHAWEPKVQVP